MSSGMSCAALGRPRHGAPVKDAALGRYPGPMKTLCLALLAAAFLAACEREGPLERAGENADRAIERAGDKIEKATDRK